jgi:hypothetical protein
VVLISFSFMHRDGEHFFMCFLAIWTSFFEKVLFSSVPHCFIGSLILGKFSFLSSPNILVISLLSDTKLAKIFSYSVSHLFNLETTSFVVQKFLISCSPICQTFLLVARLLQFYCASPCLYLLLPVYSWLFPILPSRFQV